MRGDKLKAILKILAGKSVVFNTRIWREGQEICMSSIEGGGGLVSGCIIHAGEGFQIKKGPVVRFPLMDRLATETEVKA